MGAAAGWVGGGALPPAALIAAIGVFLILSNAVRIRYGANALAGLINIRTRQPGETFEARTGLEVAVAERDPIVVMLPLRVWWYDALRPDPRFRRLVERMRLT